MYPITLYLYSDTTILSPSRNRKFSVVNLEFILHLYKLILVATGVISPTAMLAIMPIFFLIFVLVVVKKPYFCF